jgi:hypothetical protein
VVSSHEKAGEIVAHLRLRSFPNTMLSLVFLDPVRPPRAADLDMSGACARFGGAVGFFNNVSAVHVTGLGRAIVGGALVPSLQGEPRGLAGALSRLGVSVLEARQCERDLRAGDILVAVHVEPPDARAYVQKVLESLGAATGCREGRAELAYESAA